MALLKLISIVAVLMAVGAHHDDDIIPLINAVNEVVLVQKSATCVILVVDDRIQLVSSEDTSIHELSKCVNVSNKNLEVVRETFEYLNPLDVLEKLERISSNRSSFLAYFTVASHKHSGEQLPDPKHSYIPIQKPHGGLLGHATLDAKISHINSILNPLNIFGLKGHEKTV